ncbi:MAG: glycerophosphodiester phosphodiesterase family protein [Ruminococcus sp.]|nr:glycerophosphodiester phosphodiesterase family protein [Ruminococcus sp.]
MIFGKYIAHRGLHGGNIPENSLTAFKAAADNGLAIELDVRLTKDCKLVVFHDKDLMRMCGVEGNVRDYTYNQLGAFTLKGSDEKIPLLTDVLKCVGGRVPLLIEIKNGEPLISTEKRLNALLKKYVGDYAVQSFDPLSMLWFRIFAPNVTRGQLISQNKKNFDLEYILRLICANPLVWRLISKPDFISADLRSASQSQKQQAQEIGADYIIWTVRTKQQLKAANYFTDTVIFEDIAILEEVR